MAGLLSRHARSLSVVGGFLFGTAGSLWAFAFDDRLGNEMKVMADAKAELTRQVQSLDDIASEYFIANQQGDLIFLTANQGQVRRDVAELIYKGNLLDRATPVRNMIGALAIAKQLDYRKTYDAYVALNDEARARLTIENFMKLKHTEREIISRGQDRVPILTKELFRIETAMNANSQAQDKNRVIGLVSSFVGSFLLLFANLFALRQDR